MSFERKIIYDNITQYINNYYRAQDERMHIFRKESEANNVPIILEETESFLKVLLNIKKPMRILELGTAVGYSACFFAKETQADIYTIERDENTYIQAKNNIKKLGYDNRIHVLNYDGVEGVKKLKKTEIKFDFIFIDAAKSHYKRFLDASLEIATDDVTIVCDNVLLRGLVARLPEDTPRKHRANVRNLRDFNEFVLCDSRFVSSLVSIGDGLTITTLKKE